MAEDFYYRELTLPMYPAMSDSDIEKVIEKTKMIFK